MPAPKKQSKTDTFLAFHKESVAMRENNDCGVKALAIVTGSDYNTVHALLAKWGRKNRGSSPFDAMRRTLWELGFGYDITPIKSILDSYPGHWKKLPTLTTYHPVRVAAAWQDRPACLLFSTAHVSAFRDGQLHDWANGSAKRVSMVWTIRPINEAERAKLAEAIESKDKIAF